MIILCLFLGYEPQIYQKRVRVERRNGGIVKGHKGFYEGCRSLISWWIGLGGLVQRWIQILCVVRTGVRCVVCWRMILAF